MSVASLWLNRVMKGLLLFLCSTANVTIKAESASNGHSKDTKISTLVEEPRGCLLNNDLVCGVRANSLISGFELDGVVFTLKQGSIMIRVAPRQWYLSQGVFWVESNQSVTLKTQFGQILSDQILNTLIEVEPGFVDVTPLGEDAYLMPTGVVNVYKVDVGLVARLESRHREGLKDLGVPLSAPLSEVLKTWGELHKGSDSEFVSLSRQYRLKWEVQAERMRDFHTRLYQREVAAAELKSQMEMEKKQRREAENQKLRDLLKAKTYH